MHSSCPKMLLPETLQENSIAAPSAEKPLEPGDLLPAYHPAWCSQKSERHGFVSKARALLQLAPAMLLICYVRVHTVNRTVLILAS